MIPSLLATEIIRKIILFQLPSINHTSHTERYNYLLKCCFVSSNWKSIAQEELIKHIVIKDSKTFECIFRELTRREELNIETKISSVKLYGDKVYAITWWNTGRKLLLLFKKVEEIWISGFHFNQLFDKELFDWSGFNDLKSLHVINHNKNNVTLNQVLKFNSISFPSLTHLTLFNVFDAQDLILTQYTLNKFLHKKIFPSLTSFAFFITNTDTESAPEFTIPESISRQLERLVVYDTFGVTVASMMEGLINLSSLESLTLFNANVLESEFDLPSNLTFISVKHHIDEDSERFRKWIETVDSQQQLRTLSLTFNSSSLEVQESLAHLSIYLADRGIKLILNKESSFEDSSWEKLTDILLESES